MIVIDSFSGNYHFLSNFYPATVSYEGLEYRTVEHAYQAAKTLDKDERLRILQLETPSKAKRCGRSVNLRKDWEVVKLEVMYSLVWQKFLLHEDLKEKLLATGTAELIEGNHWGDTFWGVCKGKGNNHLGRILMKVREELNVRESGH